MDKKQFHKLYQDAVVTHSQRPRNFHALKKHTHTAHGYNPVCGDQITIYVYVRDNQFRDLSFTGDCCAVCKSSTSIMIDRLENAKIDEFQNLFEQFERLLQHQLDPDQNENSLGPATIFKGIWEYPARIKCASLGWHTLNAALNNQPDVTTE